MQFHSNVIFQSASRVASARERRVDNWLRSRKVVKVEILYPEVIVEDSAGIFLSTSLNCKQ
jgi:hypothetical protein